LEFLATESTGVELICSLDIQQRKYLLHVLDARKWLRSRSQMLLRGSTVVGFPFQEIGAECIIIMCLMVKYSIGDQLDEMYGHYSPLQVPPKGLKSLLCNNPKDIHFCLIELFKV
jgi:hypothetical protein